MRFAAIVTVVFAALAHALPASAEKRIALVIGNDRYIHLSAEQQLRNAVNDARAVGDTLDKLGFEVIRGENLDRRALGAKVDDLANRLTPGDTAFFFFAGHGIAIAGSNYILPSDVLGNGTEASVAREAFEEHDIIRQFQGTGVKVAVAVFDACRDNPFARPGGRGIGTARGFVRSDQVRGVFSLYSAGYGQRALDRLDEQDGNPNSVFTRVLVSALGRPGLHLGELAIEVREEVARLAAMVGHDQRPAYYDETVGGRVYLAGLPTPVAPVGNPNPPPAADAVAQAWAAVRDSNRIADFEAFASSYAGTFYARLAQNRLEELKKPQPVAAPSAPAQSTGVPAPSPAPAQVAVAAPSAPAQSPGIPAPSPALPPAPSPAAAQVAVVAPPVVPTLPPADPCAGPTTVSFPTRCNAPLTAERERSLKPKDSFRECEHCPEMVVLPVGSFTMGSPASEKDRSDNEGPQHVVKFDGPFAAGKFHVTVDQFRTFVAETKYDAGSRCFTANGGVIGERPGLSWRNPGLPQEGSHPAVCLSWNDAKAYVDWLAKKIGKPYRLLTEAEWEYAARARTMPGVYPRYTFGDDPSDFCRYGNIYDATGVKALSFGGSVALPWSVACDDGHAYTSPVGSFAPNDFGLYDMQGNAWQWTADCWHDNFQKAPTDGSAWTMQAGGDCRRHVRRGNAIFDGGRRLRVAVRVWLISPTREATTGFRVARTLLAP